MGVVKRNCSDDRHNTHTDTFVLRMDITIAIIDIE
jgi:hypothetical protein